MGYWMAVRNGLRRTIQSGPLLVGPLIKTCSRNGASAPFHLSHDVMRPAGTAHPAANARSGEATRRQVRGLFNAHKTIRGTTRLTPAPVVCLVKKQSAAKKPLPAIKAPD